MIVPYTAGDNTPDILAVIPGTCRSGTRELRDDLGRIPVQLAFLLRCIEQRTITHVPYKGAAPGLTDLASGQIPMMTPNVGAPLLQFHRAGKVRILAVNAPERIKAAPDIPTAIEAGLPNMVAANFNGLFAPSGTPPTILDQIARLTRTAMADEGLHTAMIESGFEPVLDSSPEAAQKLAADETARWLPIVKETGFKME
jgi:tripartite-type tricarboxylate transporter receptor subunit TctC